MNRSMHMHLQTRLSRRTVQKLALALPPTMLLATHGRTFAQEATPGALSADLQQFGDDTYAFVNSGYISLFIVTDEGVIATDPGSQSGPERAEAYRAAIASVTDQPVRYLIYSHDHADHATGERSSPRPPRSSRTATRSRSWRPLTIPARRCRRSPLPTS